MLMQQDGELCVCELTHALGISQPKISRHLAQLRESELVLSRREGLWIHYRINPDLPSWCHGALANALEGISTNPDFIKHNDQLQTMSDRPPKACCA